MSDTNDTLQRADAPPVQADNEDLRVMLAELREAVEGLAGNIAPTLFCTDAELIERLGVPEKIARDAIRLLDHDPHSGFPKKNKLWGDRRCWEAVRAYFLKANGLTVDAPPTRRERHA